jgi:hypothetical protein
MLEKSSRLWARLRHSSRFSPRGNTVSLGFFPHEVVYARDMPRGGLELYFEALGSMFDRSTEGPCELPPPSDPFLQMIF